MKEKTESFFSQIRTQKANSLFNFITSSFGFNVITIKRWANKDGKPCYTLEVGLQRPSNAPKCRRTQADRKRQEKINKANNILCDEEFESLELLIEGLTEIVEDRKKFFK